MHSPSGLMVVCPKGRTGRREQLVDLRVNTRTPRWPPRPFPSPQHKECRRGDRMVSPQGGVSMGK